MSLCRITDEDGLAAVLEAEDLGVVSLDLAKLVHELELVDPNVPGPVARGQLLAVVGYPDTPDPVPLVVGLLGVPVGVGRVGLLDVAEVSVDVDGLEELVGIDVALVQRVGGHVVVQVPDPNGVVRAAGDEGPRRQNRFLVVSGCRVNLDAPDAGRVEDEGVGLADLEVNDHRYLTHQNKLATG